MEHKEGVAPVDAIRERVKRLRGAKGWSAAELGDRLTRLGVPWDRSIVANFENGRRKNVTVVELLALARIFDVAPIHLLVPVDGRDFQVTPTETQPATRARDWIRGRQPLPGTDARTFQAEKPLEELQAKRELFERMGSWGAVDVEAEKRRDPAPWGDDDGEGS